jgi:ankyrin repeat protein
MWRIAAASLVLLSVAGCQRADVTRLTSYAKANDVAGVKSELAKGFDPGMLNSKEGTETTTPLHIAAENGNVDILKLFLASGVNVNLRRGDGATALLLATLKGKTEAAELLLQNGADPNLGTNLAIATFPLVVAVAQQNHTLIRDLVDHGANVRAESGPITPLITAASSGDLDSAFLFLSHGADINQSPKDGLRPVDFAVKNGDTRMLLNLLARGGEPSSWAGDIQIALDNHDLMTAGMLRAALRNRATSSKKPASSPQSK